jgi:hypothetical protein
MAPELVAALYQEAREICQDSGLFADLNPTQQKEAVENTFNDLLTCGAYATA